MRTMIDLGSHQMRGVRGGGGGVGGLPTSLSYTINSPTSVDCAREARLRRSFRSLIDCLVPYCCSDHSSEDDASSSFSSFSSSSNASSSSVVTATFFGLRRGRRVTLFLHADPRCGGPPLLALDLSLPTAHLARLLDRGLLRIALESHRVHESDPDYSPLFLVPVWSLYCNGRKVGFATRRNLTNSDASLLALMRTVSVGAGVLPGANDDVLYMRARFERVTGSCDSESFHMISPGGGGNSGQELSIFLLRS